MSPNQSNGISRHNSSTIPVSNNLLPESSNSSLLNVNHGDAYALSHNNGQKWISSPSQSPPSSSPSSFKFLHNPLSMFRSLFPSLQSLLIPTCGGSAIDSPSYGNSTSPAINQKRLTGTFFGEKKGRVSFAVQQTPRTEPILIIELPTTTSHLIKEMASGVVRILLECERKGNGSMKKIALWDEGRWSVYCNGHKLGYAISRERTESDMHVLNTVQTVSVGAGVVPAARRQLPPPASHSVDQKASNDDDDNQSEIMYMRAKFDRVIGSKDSEAFYMINPDRSRGVNKYVVSGGPELSIFMLRV